MTLPKRQSLEHSLSHGRSIPELLEMIQTAEATIHEYEVICGRYAGDMRLAISHQLMSLAIQILKGLR